MRTHSGKMDAGQGQQTECTQVIFGWLGPLVHIYAGLPLTDSNVNMLVVKLEIDDLKKSTSSCDPEGIQGLSGISGAWTPAQNKATS